MTTLASCIGKTPLVALSTAGLTNRRAQVFAKLEGNNPGGSVKDRAALAMFAGAKARGTLKEGMRIIEPTSGNTGIALAMIAARERHPITLVMPENMTEERKAVMLAYGAHIELTPAEHSMEGSIDLARAMVAAGEGIMFDQFANPDNWRAHLQGTGPEIWADTAGRVTHFVSAMGTTGTIMGVSRALKERNASIQIIGVHPDSHSKIPGIRRWPEAYLPKIFEPARVDRIMEVSAAEAKDMTHRLARDEGLFVGHSAGGAAAAAVRLANSLQDEHSLIVVILPDRGDRYLSSDLF